MIDVATALEAVFGPTRWDGWRADDGYDLVKIEAMRKAAYSWTPTDAHSHFFLVGKTGPGNWYARCRCGRGVSSGSLHRAVWRWTADNPDTEWPYMIVKPQ